MGLGDTLTNRVTCVTRVTYIDKLMIFKDLCGVTQL